MRATCLALLAVLQSSIFVIGCGNAPSIGHGDDASNMCVWPGCDDKCRGSRYDLSERLAACMTGKRDAGYCPKFCHSVSLHGERAGCSGDRLCVDVYSSELRLKQLGFWFGCYSECRDGSCAEGEICHTVALRRPRSGDFRLCIPKEAFFDGPPSTK